MITTAILLISSVVGIGAADPPDREGETNGLSDQEYAMLWSKDVDSGVGDVEPTGMADQQETAIQQLSAGTDITFKQPPSMASTWTKNDFEDLSAGGSKTSVHPPHARLEDGEFLKQAHATVFAVHPSTRGHLSPTETPLYIAQEGALRGFVDYRVRVPSRQVWRNTTVEWSLTDHEIDTIRLKKDGTTVFEQEGTATPILRYEFNNDASTRLVFEATITVRLKKTIRTDYGNDTEVRVTYQSEQLTVSDSIDVEIYNLSVYGYRATYPNGDSGIAVFQSRPWTGLKLDTETRVRGIWRFYTARNTNWDTLIRSTRNGSSTIESDAIPVYVHAYPSRIGPRADPVGAKPEIIDTWGIERRSPNNTFSENVHIDVLSGSYNTTYGVAVRAEDTNLESIRVTGIVRGVNASLVEPAVGYKRELRRSNLTVAILQRNQSHVTLRIELRDERSGRPIVLDETSRLAPISERPRSGYVTIGDQKIETNASGVAIVTLDQPGIYRARYHPGSWLGHDPAYVSDTATVRWHPLRTIDGWFALFVEIVWQFIPFVVMYYAGIRLLRMLGQEDIFQRNQ